MLNAEKDVLSSALYKARNEIKRLDLDNLYSFLSSLATQAALLAGFAFGALQPYDTDNDSFWNVCLQLFVIVTLGAEMYVVCNGMLVTVLGPTLALNGPKGSMERAVYLMRRERGTIFNMFGIGLLGFFGMIICLSAIYMPIGIAAVCMVISAGFAVLTITVSRRILIDFKFEEPKYTERVRVGNDGNPLTAIDDTYKDSNNKSKRKSIGQGNISAAEFLNMDDPNAGKFVDSSSDKVQRGDEEVEEIERRNNRNNLDTNNINESSTTNLLASVFKK